MKEPIYDIECQDKEGFWWCFDNIEGLEEAKERAQAEREEYPHDGAIRIKRREDPPKAGAKIWYKPTQPDAFQGFSYPTEVVGTIVETGLSKDMFTWILVKPDFGAPNWREERILMRDFHKRGVREYGLKP